MNEWGGMKTSAIKSSYVHNIKALPNQTFLEKFLKYKPVLSLDKMVKIIFEIKAN